MTKASAMISNKTLKDSSGFTLIELLVSLLMVAGLLTAAMSTFLNTMRESRDHEMISRTEELGRTMLDTIAYDLRMIGSGMPGAQDNFRVTDVTLGTSPYPIFVDSTATMVHFRLNEQGRSTMVDTDFTPGMMSTDIDVVDVEGFAIGDEVYLSNAVLDGDDGLHGEVTGIAGNTITVGGAFVASAGATFDAGSILQQVREVSYDASDPVLGVMRDDGNGPMALAPNSSFTLEYLESDGSAIALPLDAAKISNQLSAIRLTVTVTSAASLANGAPYTATAEQVVSIRYLTLYR